MVWPPAPPHKISSTNAPGRWLNRLARSGGLASQLSLILPLLSGALLVLQTWWLAHTLQLAVVDGRSAADLVAPVAVIGALYVARIGLGFAGELAATTAAETIKLRLRRALFGQLLSASAGWMTTRSGGAFAGVVVEQVEAMDGFLSRYMPAMVQAAILPIAFAVVLIPFDWVVAALLLVSAPLIPVFMALAGWGAEAASRRQATALSRLGGYFADRLRGIVTLKLFNREEAEVEAVGSASEQLRRRTMRVMRIAFLSSAVLEFFAALGVAGVALYVGLTFLHLVRLRPDPLSLEAGLFCLLMAPEVFQPLRLLAAHYHDRAAAKAATAEIEAQLGTLPEAAPPKRAVALARDDETAPAVTLSQVRVSTPDGRPIIREASIGIAAGTHVAILGRSGAGKSTLLEALAGLRPYDGTIRLDGLELSTVEPSVLRRSTLLLGQRPTLFAGSIASNIRLGRPSACDTAVRLAAQRARVGDFAVGLPHGLGTPLREAGLGLSGGEIQRVSLARLYLRNPGLLLLDEPTAHLDAATEAAVLDGLLEFAHGRTLIIVTHSEAVAARMDQCYRLVEGRLLPSPRPRRREPGLRGAA